jgi:hypothetical protein
MVDAIVFGVALALGVLSLILGPQVEEWLVWAIPVVDPVVTPLLLGLLYLGVTAYGAYRLYKNGGSSVRKLKEAYRAYRKRREVREANKQDLPPDRDSIKAQGAAPPAE